MENKVIMYPITCGEWLNRESTPHTPILWSKKGVTSLEQLKSEVYSLYERISPLPAERIALFFDDHLSFIVSLLACLHAGKIPVLLGHAKLSRMISEQDSYDLLLCSYPLDEPINYQVYQPYETSGSRITPLPDLHPQQTLEIFTSGTSGRPKKIIKTLKQMDDEIRLIYPLLRSRLQQCYLCTSVSPSHLYGLTFTVWLPLSTGVPVSQHRIVYAEQYSTLCATHRYAFVTSPAFLKRIDETLPPSRTSLLLSAGGKLDQSTVLNTQSWLTTGIDEIYGSSETGIMAHRYRDAEEPAWCCLPGIEFHPSSGGWRVSSPLLSEQTDLALSDELSFIDERHFNLVGRLSRLVKLEEKRISLDEIEQRILGLNGIQEVAVFTVALQGRERIVALIVTSPELKQQWLHQKLLTERQWRKELGNSLDDIALPRYWRIVDRIPCNAMNKREYSRLKELFFETL